VVAVMPVVSLSEVCVEGEDEIVLLLICSCVEFLSRASHVSTLVAELVSSGSRSCCVMGRADGRLNNKIDTRQQKKEPQ